MNITDMLVADLGWLYHGTLRERLANIAADGLRPQGWSNYDLTPSNCNPYLAKWSVGKVFLSTDPQDACSYAQITEKFAGGQPILLRVPAFTVVDPHQDTRGHGRADIFTKHPIRPEHIEVWTRGGWQPFDATRAPKWADRSDFESVDRPHQPQSIR